MRTRCDRPLVPLVVVALSTALPAVAQGGEAQVEAELRRSVREWLFLDASLGASYRRLEYAEGAAPGSDDRSELRVRVAGRAGEPDGPLGAYFGLGAVGRLRPSLGADTGDPLADPYDELDAARSFRLLGGYVEYQLRDDRARPRLLARAGRMTDFDRRSSMLLYDGASFEARLGQHLTVRLRGGRRAILDGDLPDRRVDLPAQLVAGASVGGRAGPISVTASYRYEEAHRAALDADWAPAETVDLHLGGEVLSGRGSSEGEALLAGLVALDGAAWTGGASFFVDWQIEILIDEDPRPFGRGGLAPRPEDLRAASDAPVAESRLDRLFIAPERSRLRAVVSAEQWLTPGLALQGGVFARVPFEAAGRTDLRPQVVEAWLGPELTLEVGTRLGAEARAALLDPGEGERTFAGAGDGERSRGSVRLFAEHGFAIAGVHRLTLRADAEGEIYGYGGPFADLANQKVFSATVLAALSSSGGWRTAVRWGVERLPELAADGVSLGQRVEVWVGGQL